MVHLSFPIKTQLPRIAASPEIAILLCCARTQISPGLAEQLNQLITADVNWDYLLKIAFEQSLTTLVYKNLSEFCWRKVPASILSTLQEHSQFTLLRNLSLTRELLNILKLCQTHQIPVLPYKGPVLAVLLYGKLSLREFCDLDLIVQPKDFFRVADLLIEKGYQSTFPAFNDAHERTYYRYYTELSLNKNEEIYVDLHHAIAPRYFQFTYQLNDLLEHAEVVDLVGTPVPHLGIEELLVVLCIHGAKDYWSQLKWICDLSELLQRYSQLNWDFIWSIVKQHSAKRRLLVGLGLAESLLDAPLPRFIQKKIQSDRESQALIAQVSSRLFRHQQPSFFPLLINKYIFHARLMDSFGKQFAYCLRYLGHLLNRPINKYGGRILQKTALLKKNSG